MSLSEEQNLSIYPHVAFLTAKKLHGVFELSNPSLIPLEVSVSARFGYTEATENGREVVVENTSGSPLGDLSSVVDIHPEVLVLQPGELGRRETLVYTRSRVRIPLDRVPEGGAVFLRFAPRGSERVPLPASVPWNAPRRDIGAAEDKDRSRTPATLVQKP